MMSKNKEPRFRKTSEEPTEDKKFVQNSTKKKNMFGSF